MNKKISTLLCIMLCMVLGSCKKDKKQEEVIDNSPLYQQFGFGKKYTTLTVNPMYDTENVSEDFIQRWNIAKQNLLVNYGGRQLQSFELRYISATQLTIRVSYRSDTGIAVGIYTYNYTASDEGNITLSRATTNTNALNLSPYITAVFRDYIEAYQFKPDWIADKFPNSKGSIAAFYKSDDPDSYFYGSIK